jgi:hypothetical protein
MAGGVVRIDDGETGAEQCRAYPAALGIRMDSEGLQVPDRLARERPLKGGSGSRELRERTRGRDRGAQQRRYHAGLAQQVQRKPAGRLPQRDSGQLTIQERTNGASVNGGIPGGGGLERDEDSVADPRVRELDAERWIVVMTCGKQPSSRCGVGSAERIDPQSGHGCAH